MSSLELLPAVDVKDGRAVRLVQGELDAETAYGNPLEVALEFQSAGAQWLHLVDLDAAFGRGENSALLAEVVGKLDIKVELSVGYVMMNLFVVHLRQDVDASISVQQRSKIPNGRHVSSQSMETALQ